MNRGPGAHARYLKAKQMYADKAPVRDIIAICGIGGDTMTRIRRESGARRFQAQWSRKAKAPDIPPPDDLAIAEAVPASELSIGRCVWLVSQSPRLFCGKPEHPACKPYCHECEPLARKNRQPPRWSPSGSTTKGR